MRNLSIAAAQTAPVPRDPQATLARLGAQARSLRAAIGHLQMLVFPELHLAALPRPFSEGAVKPEELAVEIPGELTEELGRIARECELWLVPGSVYEADPSGTYNTALVFSPDGELVTTYRKVFPWQPQETCSPGERFVTFDVPGLGRVGLATCYDASFPETCRQLAWMGAEVVLHVSLTTTSDREAEVVLARANAIFNQMYVVSLNAASPAALGRSLVVDPEGLVRHSAGDGEEVLTDVMDLDAVARVRELGTAGVSRFWDQIARRVGDLDLPMYRR